MRKKTGHMNFDDITKLINGRPGIRFNRVAWGADLWLEYIWVWDKYVPTWCGERSGVVIRSPWGSYDIGGKEKRDWRIMQDLKTGRIPEL